MQDWRRGPASLGRSAYDTARRAARVTARQRVETPMPQPERRAASRRRLCGVTLIEALLCAAIAGVLLASALPGLHAALDQQKLTAAANELVLSIHLARGEAMARRMRVAIEPRDARAWASGWRVFVDDNGDGHLDADELVVRDFGPVPPAMTIVPVFGAYDGRVLSFDPAGRLRRPGSNGLLLGRLTLTLRAGARTICLSAASVRAVRAPACT
jgi:type IV fimbrial biogenesis protein FimT